MPSALLPSTSASTNYAKLDKTFPTWEYDLIRSVGGRPTNAKLVGLNLWAQSEGMPDHANNWLAIEDPNNEFGKSAGNWNSAGVATFQTRNQGIQATTNFLAAKDYAPIVAALRSDNTTVLDLYKAINNSTWNGGATYPNALFSYLSHTGENPPIWKGGSTTGPHGSQPGRGPATFTQCNSANTMLGGGGLGVKWNIMNPCQAKALVSGVLIAVGALIMVGGISLFVKEEVSASLLKTLAGSSNSSPAPQSSSVFSSSTPETPAESSSTLESDRARWSKQHGTPWAESKAGRAASGSSS